jgi:hypothetical protein
MNEFETFKNSRVTPSVYRSMLYGEVIGGIGFPAGGRKMMNKIGLDREPLMFKGDYGLPRVRSMAMKKLKEMIDISTEWLEILAEANDLDQQLSLMPGEDSATLVKTWNTCAFIICDYLLREKGCMGITPDRSFLDDPKIY